jgi:hypothetical protein
MENAGPQMPCDISIFADLKNLRIKYPVLFFLCLLIILSCRKKEEPAPQPQPVVNEPPKKGSLSIYVVAYDSLGGIEHTAENIQVKITQTGQSAMTNTAGNVTFTDIPYGVITPVLIKEGYEGPPQTVNVNASTAAVSLPCAKRSAFIIQNFSGAVVHQDSISISFTLDKPVPQGKFVRIAVLSSTSPQLTSLKFETADVITTTSQNVFTNIAHLPAFRTALEQTDSTKFYIGAIALSYGLFESNITGKSVLLGDNLFYPPNLTFNKNW